MASSVFGSTLRACANVACTSGHRDCLTALKINEDSRIIGMAFRFTLPSTHACHYLALAVGIFAGLLTMVATQVQVITDYPRPVFLKIPWRYTFFPTKIDFQKPAPAII